MLIFQETRVPLRLVLLKIFNALCVLDATAISLLLFSILTTELTEELRRNIDGEIVGLFELVHGKRYKLLFLKSLG